MKLTITINDGSLAGQRFELRNGHMSIGRTATCTVRFDPLVEKIASSQHAFVEARAGGFHLTDNNSTNGTYVNGERVSQVMLNDGDQIQFGTNGITAAVSVEGVAVADAVVGDTAVGDATIAYSPEASYNATEVQQLSNNFTAPASVDLKTSMASLGMGRIEIDPEPVEEEEGLSTAAYIGIGGTVLAILFLLVMVGLIMLASLGPIAAFIATIVAFTPVALYLLPLYWLDRYDPEPIWLIGLAFAWGALLSVFISFFANTFVGIGVTVATRSPELGQIAGAVLAAPFFEELTKGAGLLMIILVFRRYFDGILDGIIFGGVIALGFATVENVLYYGRGLGFGGVQGLITIFVLRGILTPFAHVTFTAMTGIGFGIARETHNPFLKYTAPVVGLGMSMFLHALWNGMAVFLGGGFLIAYVVVEIPLFLILIGFSGWIMWRQNRILKGNAGD